MVVDTSALIAILLGEPTGPRLIVSLSTAPTLAMSAATYLEASIVIEARRPGLGRTQLDALLTRAAVARVPFDRQQADTAVSAYARFGKGHHPARLNMGDCFS